MNGTMRGVVVYVALLACAFGFAYRSWTGVEEPDLSKAAIILDAKPDELSAVRFSSEKIDVSLEMRADELGTYVWVRSTPKPARPTDTPDAPDTPPDPHAARPEDPEPSEFKAGAVGDELVASLAPFAAKRMLEGVDETKLDELGLATPEGTIVIERTGRDTKTYEVGGSVYGGSTMYVRDPENGAIYVVEAQLVRRLKNASGKLLDRTLFAIPQNEIVQVAVKAGEAEAVFVQRNPDDTRATFWSAPQETEANETAGGWLDKALRLKVSRYVAAGEEPSSLEAAFSFVVAAGGRKVVEVNVFRAWGADGEENWYARSAHTRALVELQRSGAAEAAADVAAVLDSAQ